MYVGLDVENAYEKKEKEITTLIITFCLVLRWLMS